MVTQRGADLLMQCAPGHRFRASLPGACPVGTCMEWEGDLPPGYRIVRNADLLTLLRPDGSLVAAFSAQGADPLEVIAAAWEDAE